MHCGSRGGISGEESIPVLGLTLGVSMQWGALQESTVWGPVCGELQKPGAYAVTWDVTKGRSLQKTEGRGWEGTPWSRHWAERWRWAAPC